MTPRVSLRLLVAGALLLAAPVRAQQLARVDVPGQDGVTGLEMGIEGSLRAIPGGRLRWFVTVHEIVAGRELRPAARAALKVLASFQPAKPLLETVSDAGGRARIELAIPAELERSFELVVEARSPRRVKRRFDVTVELDKRYRTELHLDRRSVAPGGELRAWGRVLDRARARPAAGRAVSVRAREGTRLIGRVQETTTDARGFFQLALRAPRADRASFSVEARADDADPVTLTGLSTRPPPRAALEVVAWPRHRVAAPGATVQVEVVVRTPEGRPVPRATLSGLSIPRAKAGEEVKPTLTDARGRALVPWRVVSTAPVADVTGSVHATREGLGSESATVRVRVTRRARVLAWAVEGGALVPGLPGRLFVRVFHPDGRPLPDEAVSLAEGQVTARAVARCDADGVAVLEVEVGKPGAESACSGPTMAAAAVRLGSSASYSEELCVPVDPEATVRVRPRAPALSAGQPLELELEPRPEVAAAPIAVTVLAHPPGAAGWQPVAQAIAPARARRLTLRTPPEALGLLWVRARPLVGPARQEVRGGGALVSALPGPALALRVAPSGAGVALTLRGGGQGSASGFAFALPVDEGERLLEALRARGPELAATQASLAGYLAAHTPVDEAAAAVLQQGKLLPVAMPATPAELGLLRDPWRSRARFIRGRLGRLFRAVEEHVEEQLPEGLRQVAVRAPGGWRFNQEILRAVAGKLGAESMSGLDGSALTIEALQRLDRAFVYDNVARRITRQRLFRLLVALRGFVRAHRLDHTWSPQRDPAAWLSALAEPDSAQDSDDDTEQRAITREQLFDAWGKPFVLRRARGGRARFRALEPVVGYELVSAGPDGKLGTADDVHDPFGRVLARGVYAEAIGEETLLARLQGVELGRATLKKLAEVFEVEAAGEEGAPAAAGSKPWSAPRPLEPLGADELIHRRADAPSPGAAVFRALGPEPALVTFPLPPEPRRYLVVAGAYGPAGVAAFAAAPLRAGAPLLLDASLPQQLRSGEQLVVPVRLTNLRDGQRLTLRLRSDGPLEAALQATTGPGTAAGESRVVPLRLGASASRTGDAQVHLQVRDASGALLRETRYRVRVIGEGSLRAQHTGALVRDRAALRFELPADAQDARAVLTVSGPRDLLRDPGLRELGRDHPALLAWAHVLRGQPVSAALLDALSARDPVRRARPANALEHACAAVALSASRLDRPARPELRATLAALPSSLPASLRERSAVLVALAAGAPGLTRSGEPGDPVASLVSELREEAWNAVESEQARPEVMARLAAGLLLLDRSDAAGQKLFASARAALTRGPHGGRVLGGPAGQGLEAWIGTTALTIAARQLGEDALAAELAAGIAPRLYLGLGGAEPGFWLLAASVHGAFGSAGPRAVELESDGAAPRRLELGEGGVGTLSLAGGRGRRVVVVRSLDGRPVLARLEARYLRPVAPAKAAPLSARLEGHVGHVGETAALELTVASESAKSVERPVLEVLLPGAARLDEPARRSLARAAAVLRVEPPDLQGLLRIHLRPLEPRQQHRLPLPVRWIGGGRCRGLSLAVFDADRPWQVSSVPARSLHLAPPPEEVW
jgi:hypothetical protein